MIKLSIIIPVYNAEPYIHELIDCLAPQITEKIEVICVDDGSRTPFVPEDVRIKCIRQSNGGVSKARNTGLAAAQGEYVAFIDADDMVSEDYVQTILETIEEEQFDYCYLSWRTFGGGWNYKVELKSIQDKFPEFNLCVWNRIYKRSMIGNVRFNEAKKIAEDAQFIREVKEEGKKKAFIPQALYFYRTGHGGNLTERFTKGEIDTKRYVYYFKHITKDMEWLIPEITERDKEAEVIVMTEKNDLKELEQITMVIPPRKIKGHVLCGEKTELFQQIPKPIVTQVVIYIGNSQAIGGVETFIYNFCKQMHKYYDIMVIFSEHMDALQIMRLAEMVPVIRNPMKTIICDTVINQRITDDIPSNIRYGKKVQMCHTCQMAAAGKYHYTIKKGWDELVFVSQVAAESFKDQAEKYRVIPNLTEEEKPKKTLMLLSAQRMTYEKGEQRIIQLAKKMHKEGIPFLWLIFTYEPLKEMVPGIVIIKPTLDIRSYMERANYIVALSDIEAFGYTIEEAMELGVPVLTTPISVLPELGFKEGIHGWTVPFEIEKADVRKYYEDIPTPAPKKNKNKAIRKQWKEILGDSKPTHSYVPDNEFITVRINKGYGDLELGRFLQKGEVVRMRKERAMIIMNLGYAEKTE